MSKYQVIVKEDSSQPWEYQGEGPFGKATAERIARELRQAGYPAKCVTEREADRIIDAQEEIV